MTALRRPDKLRRFRDGMCAVVGMVRKKKNMKLQWDGRLRPVQWIVGKGV